MTLLPNKLKHLLDRFYDLGEITDYQAIARGQVNTGHIIETKHGRTRFRYFVREYRRGKEIAEIDFEHGLINHLVLKKFEYIGGVIESEAGLTYTQIEAGVTGLNRSACIAVFNYLPGEIQYDWTRPDCQISELKSAAVTLARYHQAVSDWRPASGLGRPGIFDQLPAIEKRLQHFQRLGRHTRLDDCLKSGLNLITGSIADTLGRLSFPEYDQMPRLAIHGDYHPGNLIFRNGQVSGLLDFDWAHMDVRCFDVALALFYFCTQWGGINDGQLDIERILLFMSAYQGAFNAARQRDPLSTIELQFLPYLIPAANLYVLDWILSDIYQGNVEAVLYTVYLQHGLNVIRWLKANPDWSHQIPKSAARSYRDWSLHN